MTDNRNMQKELIHRFAYSIFMVFATATVAQADDNKMLQREYRTGISRQMACDSQGYCYLLLPLETSKGNSGFTLKISRKPNPRSISDFSTTIPLPQLRPTMLRVLSAGLSIDSQDQLHLIWTTENGLTAYSLIEAQSLRNGNGNAKWMHPVSRQKAGVVVAGAQSWAGDICGTPDGHVWLTWTTNVAKSSEVIVHLGAVREGQWNSFEVGRGKTLYPPSLAISQDGTSFHIACGDTRGGTHVLHGKFSELGSNRQGKLQATYPGRRPALAEISNRVLAVHESGDSLKYTFLKPGAATQPSRPLTDLDSRLVWDTVHSPRLIVDQHGVPWVFFIDSTRQHVFYSRWLGTRWSPILNGFWLTRNTARFEDSHLSIDWLGVEHGHGIDKSSIGITIGHRSQAPKARFDLLPVPSLKSDVGNKVLFLDLKEVQQLDGIALKVNTATKLADPVVVGGDPGDFDSQGASKLAVIKQGGVYRAWYTGMHRQPGSKWPESGAIPYVRVGYAESKDGLRFEKPPLGLSSFEGNENTNLVAGLPATPIYRPIVPTGMHIDAADPDPSRRYKFLTWTGGTPASSLPSSPAIDAQTWTLWTSADGLRWKMASKGGIRFPGGMPASFSPQSMFHDADEDDPARKYKAYGFLGLNNDRRGAGYGYSRDAIQWTADPRNPVFDAWARATPVVRNGKVQQIHDAVVWKYHQYYLALYQYQRRGDDMTIELAMSRDGENFIYIQPGSEVVRRGAAGEWDCDMIGPSVPLVDEDEIKVYYSGYRFSRTKLIEGEHACGLATLRLDGFTHLTLEEGRDQGAITTIPIKRGAAAELLVNASCTRDNRIEVELLDPTTGVPLPRFSRKECTVLKTDKLVHRVRWGGRQLADVGKTAFKIRFHLTGQDSTPELYSFEFR